MVFYFMVIFCFYDNGINCALRSGFGYFIFVFRYFLAAKQNVCSAFQKMFLSVATVLNNFSLFNSCVSKVDLCFIFIR